MSRAALLAAVASNPDAVYTASQLADRTADVVARPVLPVPPALAELLPAGGLRRGSTVTLRGSRSVLLSLAAITRAGGAAAVVGMPDLGLLAAAECGVDTTHLAVVPRPGAQAGDVVAALLEGFPLVALAAEHVLGLGQRGSSLARRLTNRARNRDAVLVAYGTWPAPDLHVECTQGCWSGLSDGHGHLLTQELTVQVTGRGALGQARRARVRLPLEWAATRTASAGQQTAREYGRTA